MKNIPLPSPPFDLNKATKIASKFKFKVKDLETFKRKLNASYLQYIISPIFTPMRAGKLRKFFTQLLLNFEQLNTLLNNLNMHSRHYLEYHEPNEPTHNIDDFLKYLASYKLNIQRWLPLLPKDHGGAKIKDEPLKQLIGLLISIYKEYSGLEPSIGWNDIKGAYQGQLYNFIKYYLKITNIQSHIELGKYISRALHSPLKKRK